MSEIQNPLIFYGAAALLVAYVMYMMIRRRAGERSGRPDREPEL